MPLASGTRLGPYEIVAPIGAGGMGEVYKATDTRLGRIVAVKLLASEFSERFEVEARAISAVNHPNICALYDIGTHEGRGYLVLEYLEGSPLQRAHARRRCAEGGHSDRRRARSRAPERDHASRSETGQHHVDRRRVGEAAGFRARQAGDEWKYRYHADAGGDGAGNGCIHGAGAGGRAAARRAVGYFQFRRGALRVGLGTPRVSGRFDGGQC